MHLVRVRNHEASMGGVREQSVQRHAGGYNTGSSHLASERAKLKAGGGLKVATQRYR